MLGVPTEDSLHQTLQSSGLGITLLSTCPAAMHSTHVDLTCVFLDALLLRMCRYLLHEQLLGSPHRTTNPEAADFFYVPVYAALYQTHVGYAPANQNQPHEVPLED